MAGSDPTFRSQLVPVLLRVFRGAGGDVSLVARRFGLPHDAESLREIDVRLSTLYALSEETAAQTNDEDLGLHLATRLPAGSYGLLEYVGRSASTVRQALERFIRYSSLLNDISTYTLEPRGKRVALTQRVPGHPRCFGRHASELYLALLVRYLREITNTTLSLTAVGFAHPAPRATSELEAYFRAPLRFGCGENFLEAKAELLEAAIVTKDPPLHAILEEQAEILLSRSSALPRRSAGDFLERVRTRVIRALEDGQPQLGAVAGALHMSGRTLQRRLGEEGTSFLDLIDDVRETLARAHMANESLALGEVAHLLGFSQITAFTRAFKRWTGVTPARFREKARAKT